ncbi:MAG TPA: transglutaminase domain-containing protein [Kofleriaceae bacterium]|nr:transglutaminase domain-containing protein [Kofleriaceae bacterium]
MRALSVVGLSLLACAPRPLPAERDAPELPASRERHYTIWLGGARVGSATEREQWSAHGVTLRRDETMRFLRGDQLVALATTIEIEADRALVPSRVAWTEHGQHDRRADARREGDRWIMSSGQSLAGAAIPAELVPLVTRRDGGFAGPVFLPARRFLAGTGRIEAVAPTRLVARIELDGGAIAEATIDVDRDGSYARVVDGDGVIALRATAEQAARPFEPVDLIAATALPIAGTRTDTLVLDTALVPPPLPGQLARREPDGVAIALAPARHDARDRIAEIRAIVAQVRRRIAPDLGARPGTAHDAASATAGDCTTFALAYAAHATRRGIATRLVTGFRIDGARLVRHRWAISWTGRAWIAVDAAFGAVPAGGDLVGLAMHDADDAGLVAGEATLAQVHGAAWR